MMDGEVLFKGQWCKLPTGWETVGKCKPQLLEHTDYMHEC